MAISVVSTWPLSDWVVVVGRVALHHHQPPNPASSRTTTMITGIGGRLCLVMSVTSWFGRA